MEAAPDLSIVIPLYHNRDTAGELVSRLAASLADVVFEIVAVDDGGGDGSDAVLLAAAQRVGAEARVIHHTANLGQNTAVLTGLTAARGRTIVVMDADLQDPPEVVPRLVASLDREDRELAFGLREGAPARGVEVLGSRLFKGILFSLLGSGLPVRVGLFVAMRRPIRDRLVTVARPGEYLLGHLAALRRPAALVPFPRLPRPGGGSSYSPATRLRLALPALEWAWRHRARPFLPLHAAACGAVATLIALLLLGGEPFGLQDDGFRYLLSQSWANGTGLFRRFDLLYTPGAYVWYGSWMRLLGDGLWVLRLGEALLVGLTVSVVFRPVARHGGTGVAWSAGLLLGALGTGWGKMAAMGAVAGALLSFDTWRRLPSYRVLLLGLGTGLLLGWREDSAVLLGAVTVAALLAGRSPFSRWRLAGMGAAGGFGTWLLTFSTAGEGTAFLSHELHRLRLLVERLTPAGRTLGGWIMPGHIASPLDAVRASFVFLKYVPLGLYLGLLAGYLLSRRRHRPWPPATAVAAILGLLYTPQFLWEYPDIYHLRSHLLVFVIVAGTALGALRPQWRRLLAGTFLVAAAGAFTLIAWQHRAEHQVLYPVDPGHAIGARLEIDVPSWAGLPFRRGQTLIALPWCPGWYALEAVPPGTRILSALPRHLRQRNTLERLRHDLSRPTNRYVIVKGRSRDLAAPLASIVEEQYRPKAIWKDYELLERPRPGTILEPSRPLQTTP